MSLQSWYKPLRGLLASNRPVMKTYSLFPLNLHCATVQTVHLHRIGGKRQQL